MKHLYLALLCVVYVVNGVDPFRKNEQRKKRILMVIKSGSAPTKTQLQVIWTGPDFLTGIEDANTPPSQIFRNGNPTPSPSGEKIPAPTASPGHGIDLIPTPSPTGATSQPTPSPAGHIGLNPTPSPSGNSGLNPTPSPTGYSGPDPTPSPSGNIGLNPTPSPTTTIELSPTPIPTTNKGLDPTPSPSGDTGLKPTPSSTGNLALTPTPSPITTKKSNGVPTPSSTIESRSAKPTPARGKFANTTSHASILGKHHFSTTTQNGAEKAEFVIYSLVIYCCLMVLSNT